MIWYYLVFKTAVNFDVEVGGEVGSILIRGNKKKKKDLGRILCHFLLSCFFGKRTMHEEKEYAKMLKNMCNLRFGP